MKCTFIPEAPDIQFKRLEFYTRLLGNIFEQQGGEVGLSGLGAQTGELRNGYSNGIIKLGLGVWKQFQFPLGLGGHNLTPENKNWMGTLLISDHRFNLCD
jgi:hypothetical protein